MNTQVSKLLPRKRVWRPEGFVDLDLEDICRDERCDREDLHAKHIVIDDPESDLERTWIDDPFEPERWSTMKIDRTTNKQAGQHTKQANIREIPKPPWLRYSVKGLGGAVAGAISATRVKIVSEIHQDVLNNYGSCDERSVYRHLAELVEAGLVIRVSFNRNGCTPLYSKRPVGVKNGVIVDEPPKGTLSGYLKPESRLFKDPLLLKELLWDVTCGVISTSRDALEIINE